ENVAVAAVATLPGEGRATAGQECDAGTLLMAQTALADHERLARGAQRAVEPDGRHALSAPVDLRVLPYRIAPGRTDAQPWENLVARQFPAHERFRSLRFENLRPRGGQKAGGQSAKQYGFASL